MTEPDLTEALAKGELMTLSDHPFKLNGHDALYIGLTVTIYFAGPHADEVNEKLCQCMDEYIALAPYPPRWGGLPSSGQWIDLKKKGFVSPLEGISKMDPKRSWSAKYVWSQGEDDAYPWTLGALRGSYKEIASLSYLNVGFPMKWATEPRLKVLVQRWSELLNVFHGYVGIAPLLPASIIAERKSETDVFFASKRFLGVNIDLPTSQSGPLAKGIKTVDWITLLGGHYVERLGGTAKLGAELGPDYGLTPLSNGGLMIQTGALPDLGDRKKGDRSPIYVKLNRVLKPVRVPDYPYSFQSGQFCQYYMDRAAAKAWIERYDQVVDQY